MKKKILIITGPTGVGKTKLSVELAKMFDAEVISADSCQVYKGFDIGSAKVTEDEKQGVVHHLIDNRDPYDEYNAGEFARDAKKAIDEIISKGKLPIIVGGTGLYINSLLFPLTADGKRDEEYRRELEHIAELEGKEKLYSMLQEIDSESAKMLHVNQTDRIIRALEIYHTSGVKKSELKASDESQYDYLLVVLSRDREEVYDLINKRVDLMFENGLVGEVQSLLDLGISENAPAMKGIGYREVVEFIKGGLSLDETKELIKQKSRNYAKRQLTYFKKMKNANFVMYNDKKQIISMIQGFLKEKI